MLRPIVENEKRAAKAGASLWGGTGKSGSVTHPAGLDPLEERTICPNGAITCKPRATPWEPYDTNRASPERAKDLPPLCGIKHFVSPFQGIGHCGALVSQGVALGCHVCAPSGHWSLWRSCFPGRCPGLSCLRPFRAKNMPPKLAGWPASFGGGGGDDRGRIAPPDDLEARPSRIPSTPPGPKDLGRHAINPCHLISYALPPGQIARLTIFFHYFSFFC